MARRVAFVAGRRVSVDLVEGTATIAGRQHIDSFPIAKIPSRVAFYERMKARKTGRFYAPTLAAAQKVAQMAEELQEAVE